MMLLRFLLIKKFNELKLINTEVHNCCISAGWSSETESHSGE